MRFLRNLALFLGAACVSYLLVVSGWILLPAFPFFMYAEFCKAEREDGTPLASARIFFWILSWGTILLYAANIYMQFRYYPKYGNAFGIVITVFNLLTVTSTVVLHSKQFASQQSSAAPAILEASCDPSPSPAHSAPASSPAASAKNHFYAEHCDLICASITSYLKEDAALKTDAGTHTSTSVIPILFPLYLFSAVTIFIDHTLETYGFEWLNNFFVSAHKESLYPQAVKYYNEFVDIYNSCVDTYASSPDKAKEVFKSWQYKASQKAAQEIYGSSDTLSTGLVFASLCHFTQDYVELLKKQDFLPRSSFVAPVPAPPSPDSLRDPSTLIKTPDNYAPLFCRKCGAVIPIDSVYCPECGEKVVVIR